MVAAASVPVCVGISLACPHTSSIELPHSMVAKLQGKYPMSETEPGQSCYHLDDLNSSPTVPLGTTFQLVKKGISKGGLIHRFQNHRSMSITSVAAEFSGFLDSLWFPDGKDFPYTPQDKPGEVIHGFLFPLKDLFLLDSCE